MYFLERPLKEALAFKGRNANQLLAHLAKDHVSFCHHLASVVCRPLTFHILIFSSKITFTK